MPYADQLTWPGILYALIIGLGLWTLWVWVRFGVTRRIDDFFAKRRHTRKMRNYMARDVKLTMELYTEPPVRHRGRHNKKGINV